MIKGIVNNEEEKSLNDLLDTMASKDHIQSMILCIGENYSFDADELSAKLKAINKTIIGGVFPEVILDGKCTSDSAILLGLKIPMEYAIIREFDQKNILESVSEGLHENVDEKSTFIIFVDALIRDKHILFDALYNNYGSIPNYIGGGAGTLKFEPAPCIITNEGVIEGAAILATIAQKINIGVAHGWSPISTQLKVTESYKNEIISLDWKPAMEVYQEIIEEHSKKAFDYDDFFNSIKSYPLGIRRLNDNMTVRDPFKTENGRVFLLDDVDEGSYIQILYGNLETLIEGATDARKKAESDSSIEGATFIIDCISRGLFMEERFAEELKILDPSGNSFGALTLGEIANSGDEYLNVYNKTAVVGIFEK